LTYFKASLAAS